MLLLINLMNKKHNLNRKYVLNIHNIPTVLMTNMKKIQIKLKLIKQQKIHLKVQEQNIL